MTKHKLFGKGFTIIEVTLVLAIAALLFIGVIGGTSVNISRQRYNDAVQSFTEFLRRSYSEVVNTENPREDELERGAPCTVLSGTTIGNSDDTIEAGRTNCLIYGKLLTFGEDEKDDKVYSYDVLGDVADYYGDGTLNVDGLGTLAGLHVLSADVITVRNERNNCIFSLAGNSGSYLPEWDARLETTSPDHQLFKGSILIVRAPSSGAIHTYYMPEPLMVNELLSSPSGLTTCYNPSGNTQADANARLHQMSSTQLRKILKTHLNPNNTDSTIATFRQEEINICVNTEDFLALTGQRRMVRIAKDGNNASAVELIALDDGSNLCE